MLYRHKKTGGVYVILGSCRIEATNEVAVRYRRLGDNVEWVRPETEFHDGRFEPFEIEIIGIDYGVEHG